MKADIELYLLGSVQVKRNGKAVTGFESQKALALHCYLAELGQPSSRGHLAHLFWSDKTEKRGRANLSRVLHNNTTLLPNTLVLERDLVQFNFAADIYIDILHFAELLEENSLQALHQAVQLYRNVFMADIDLTGCPEFETWLLTEQEMWKQQIARTLNQLIGHCKMHGQYEEGLQLAYQLLSQDHWREEVHRDIMLMLALSGQRSAALAQYERCSQLLSEELGVNPSAETTALYYRIRAGEVRAAEPFNQAVDSIGQGVDWTSPQLSESNRWTENIEETDDTRIPSKTSNSSMRVAGTASTRYRVEGHSRQSVEDVNYANINHRTRGAFDINDKANEFNQILERLANPVCRMLTIIGPNNDVQRRLLHQIAMTSTAAFRDGVFFIGNDRSSPNSLILDLIQTLQVTISQTELDLLRAEDEKALIGFFKQLRTKAMLLVFTELHPHRNSIHLLEALLKRAPQIKVLASAQEPLNVSEEWLFDMY